MKELRALEQSGRISLHQFKYENHKSKARGSAIPSNTQYRDLKNYTYDELDKLNLAYDQLEFGINSKFSTIQKIIEAHNRRDAQHLDSAQMTKCEVFLTSDKKDIWSKKNQLLLATNLNIFLMPSEWGKFIAYTESNL